MTEAELLVKVDAINAQLRDITAQLAKATLEITTASAAQLAAIADLRAQLDAQGIVSPELQASLDAVANSTAQVAAAAQALDELNIDAV